MTGGLTDEHVLNLIKKLICLQDRMINPETELTAEANVLASRMRSASDKVGRQPLCVCNQQGGTPFPGGEGSTNYNPYKRKRVYAPRKCTLQAKKQEDKV